MLILSSDCSEVTDSSSSSSSSDTADTKKYLVLKKNVNKQQKELCNVLKLLLLLSIIKQSLKNVDNWPHIPASNKFVKIIYFYL